MRFRYLLRCLLDTFWARPSGESPRVDPELAGGIIQFILSSLGTPWDPQEELESFIGELDVWNTLLDRKSVV